MYAATANGVVVYNTATSTILNTVTQGAGASAVGVDTSLGGYAYAVVNSTVVVISGSTYTSTMSDGNHPANSESIAVNPLTHHVYVSSLGGSGLCTNGCVSIYASNQYQSTVQTGSGANTVAVDTSTDIAYAPQNAGVVTVINGATGSKIADLSVGGQDEVVGVNPITHKVYVAADYYTVNSVSENAIAVIDGATNAVDPNSPITTGPGPWAIAVNPVTNYIFVADYNNNDVTVIDGSSNSFLTSVPAGTNPDAIVVELLNNLIYVDNYGGGGSITIIDGSSLSSESANTSTVSFNTTLTPDSIAFNPVNNQVYGASSAASLGFGFGGGDFSETVYANGYVFGGATPLAVAANPVSGMSYTLLKTGTYAPYLSVSDPAAPYGFYVDVCYSASPVTMAVNPTTDSVYVPCSDGNIDVVTGASGFTSGNTTVIPKSNSFGSYSPLL